MKVSPQKPFKIIYSILNHEYLGYIFETFVVQLNDHGDFTYQVQNISPKNIGEFSHGIDNRDLELVKLVSEIHQDVILKKYNPKKLNAVDFFLKLYDPQKGDKVIQETIATYLERNKSKILEKLEGKSLFIMGSDGNPLWKQITWQPEKATIRFHFIRNEENTHYFPAIRFKGEKLDFQYKKGFLVCEEPAWLIVDENLYHFEGIVDGKKIKPFLAKKFIAIPTNVEEQYYRKFVTPLIASYDVVSRGFEIKRFTAPPKSILTISEVASSSKKAELVLFGEPESSSIDDSDNDMVMFDLTFQYGQPNKTFRPEADPTPFSVTLEKSGNDYTFYKVKRDLNIENGIVGKLRSWNFPVKNGKCILPKSQAFGWLQSNMQLLEENDITVRQSNKDTKRYFLGYSHLSIAINEDHDWFDIQAKVQFGEYEIPFIQLKNYILNNKKEFILPNGEVAVIPDWWFTKYTELFSFTESLDGALRLKMHHLALVQELKEENLATAVISRKLENLRDFNHIEPSAPPLAFIGTLRPYQKAGYDWLHFLNQYHFGGCLADDMGLGKTVQTLAFLQSLKESGAKEPNLLIMPTSLLYNWLLEAKKFTPDIRILSYTGYNREKDSEQFKDYDLILTSYGIVRLDIDILKSFRFGYVILDEAQAIKNPGSIITKAVKKLNATNRLALTGTPIENSTLDLWSQMSFLNPGLLGGQTFFRDEFQIPIEKKDDADRKKRLYNLIKPFILRRLKSEVATDLPEKVESIQFCDMTLEQETAYEEAKAYYRNMILQSIDSNGISKSQLVVLQGLTKLRQLANHPSMVNPEYVDGSGKFEDVIYRLQTILSEDHKILIFSQYIKHLDIFRAYLDEEKIVYSYLDGSTRDRQAQVENFQENDDIKVFLISLKAGGLGLNLTAADYVFILDPWWNPAIEAQAVDRAHRIGQERTVFTYKFIAKNTVEEKILSLQQSKRQLAEDLISSEEGFIKSLSRDDVIQLLS